MCMRGQRHHGQKMASLRKKHLRWILSGSSSFLDYYSSDLATSYLHYFTVSFTASLDMDAVWTIRCSFAALLMAVNQRCFYPRGPHFISFVTAGPFSLTTPSSLSASLTLPARTNKIAVCFTTFVCEPFPERNGIHLEAGLFISEIFFKKTFKNIMSWI